MVSLLSQWLCEWPSHVTETLKHFLLSLCFENNHYSYYFEGNSNVMQK